MFLNFAAKVRELIFLNTKKPKTKRYNTLMVLYPETAIEWLK